MSADEIKQEEITPGINSVKQAFEVAVWLKEIALQLAKMNERNTRQDAT